MAESGKDTAQSNFNFFAVLEDTISGVIEFLFRFVSVTLLCLFRPYRFVERYRQSGSFSEAGFPRPYTFLIFCIFSFIKGLEMLFSAGSKSTANTTDLGVYLTKVHETINQFGEITTLQIILSVFPTVVVILILSFIVAMPHRLLGGPGYRETSQVFSYVLGAQIMGALFMFYATGSIAAIVTGHTAEIISGIAFLIVLIWFIASATRSLRNWFAVEANRLVGKIALYAIYTVVVLIIAAACFYTITGAYSQLAQDSTKRLSATEKTALAAEEVGSRLVLTVYGLSIQEDTITISMLLENRSDSPYFVHEKGSVLILSAYQEALDELTAELKKSDMIDETQVRSRLGEHLDRLALGYTNVDLEQVVTDKTVLLVEPGQRQLFKYQGVMKERRTIGTGAGGMLRIPVARVNSDGSLTYASIGKDIGQQHENLFENLEKERIKSNKDMDEYIKGLQLILDQLRTEVDE